MGWWEGISLIWGTKGQVPCPKGKRKTGRQLTSYPPVFLFLFGIPQKG
jgi:hypothetical protein